MYNLFDFYRNPEKNHISLRFNVFWLAESHWMPVTICSCLIKLSSAVHKTWGTPQPCAKCESHWSPIHTCESCECSQNEKKKKKSRLQGLSLYWEYVSGWSVGCRHLRKECAGEYIFTSPQRSGYSPVVKYIFVASVVTGIGTSFSFSSFLSYCAWYSTCVTPHPDISIHKFHPGESGSLEVLVDA